MVLQRGHPIEVWGFDAAPNAKLMVALRSYDGVKLCHATVRAEASGQWSTTLRQLGADITGQLLRLTLAENGEQVHALDDVVLGDVLLFAGQSNVDLPEAYAHQSDSGAQELEENVAHQMGHSGMIRVMIVPNGKVSSGVKFGDSAPAAEPAYAQNCRTCPPPFSPSYSYCQCDALSWTRVTGPKVRGFSALAWFTATALLLSTSPLQGVPLGLVRASKGGTKISSWSSPDAMSKCPQAGAPPNAASQLFAKMIHPILRLRYSAVVWFQGASDVGAPQAYQGKAYYHCALPALISDWRAKFRHPALPFVVVELPSYCNEHDGLTFHTWCDQRHSKLHAVDHHLPDLRLAQAAAEKLPHIYMVTGIDLGSLHPTGGSIHSDRKPELGKRAAHAVAAAVYNQTAVVWRAPDALSAWSVDASRVLVNFTAYNGGGIQLDSETRCPAEVLPVYCTGAGFELRVKGKWSLAEHTQLGSDPSVIVISTNRPGEACHVDRVRYAYADWPACSVRSSSGGLPARIFDMPVRRHNAQKCSGTVVVVAGDQDDTGAGGGGGGGTFHYVPSFPRWSLPPAPRLPPLPRWSWPSLPAWRLPSLPPWRWPSLPHPRFGPPKFAEWFWPLVTSLVLLSAVAVAGWSRARHSRAVELVPAPVNGSELDKYRAAEQSELDLADIFEEVHEARSAKPCRSAPTRRRVEQVATERLQAALEDQILETRWEKWAAVDAEDYEKAHEAKQRERELMLQLAGLQRARANLLTFLSGVLLPGRSASGDEAGALTKELQQARADKRAAVNAEDFVAALAARRRERELLTRLADYRKSSPPGSPGPVEAAELVIKPLSPRSVRGESRSARFVWH